MYLSNLDYVFENYIVFHFKASNNFMLYFYVVFVIAHFLQFVRKKILKEIILRIYTSD